MNSESTVTLWRPIGPEELALVEASGWRAWPPRPPEQPIRLDPEPDVAYLCDRDAHVLAIRLSGLDLAAAAS